MASYYPKVTNNFISQSRSKVINLYWKYSFIRSIEIHSLWFKSPLGYQKRKFTTLVDSVSPISLFKNYLPKENFITVRGSWSKERFIQRHACLELRGSTILSCPSRLVIWCFAHVIGIWGGRFHKVGPGV